MCTKNNLRQCTPQTLFHIPFFAVTDCNFTHKHTHTQKDQPRSEAKNPENHIIRFLEPSLTSCLNAEVDLVFRRMGDRVATKLYILTVRKQESMKAENLIMIISVLFSMGVAPFDLIHYLD